MHLGQSILCEIDPGGYISPVKAGVVVLVVLAWARLLTWADKDAIKARLRREWLNLGLLAGMILGFAAFFFFPNFAAALVTMLVLLGVEVGIYLGLRQSTIGLEDLSFDVKGLGRRLTKRQDRSKAAVGAVKLFNRQSVSALVPPDEHDARRRGYDVTQQLLYEPILKGAQRIDMAPDGQGAQVKFCVDNIWYNAQTVEMPSSAAAIGYLKAITDLSEEERRKPQKAKLNVKVDATRYELELTTLGNAAGESLRIVVDPKAQRRVKFDNLGLSPEQKDTLRSAILERRGIVIVAAPRGQGLTTTLYSLLHAHDVYLSHIHTIERAPEDDLEGITQNALPLSASGADELKLASWVASQEPDVLGIGQIDDPRTASVLARFAAEGEGHKVYVGLRAGSTFEALGQWRKLVGDDQLAMKDLQVILAGRVMRRLCTACKVAFSPDPAALRKLNMNPAKMAKWFQARREPLRDSKGRPVGCPFCHDLRYKGTMGVYEMMVIDDELRQAVESGASASQLKAIFRTQRSKFLQEMALAQVETGETSVQEVLRVLQVDRPDAGEPQDPGTRDPKAPVAEGAPRGLG